MSFSGGSTDALFGGAAEDFLGGDGSCCDNGSMTGGAIRAFNDIYKDGRVNFSALLSTVLSIFAIIILLMLLVPILLPDLANKLMVGSDLFARFARWFYTIDVKLVLGALGAYVLYHEVYVWKHWKSI